MSFIKDPEEEKSSSLWDYVILAVLLLGGVGFWFYYKSSKTHTMKGFEKANELFMSKKWPEALKAYEELKSSDYLEPIHDSILFFRLDTLQEIMEDSKTAP